MYRNLTKFLLLVCVTAVTLAVPSIASAQQPSLPVIDDGRWGAVPSSCEGAGAGSQCDDENLITINYTRHTGNGGYVYGRCTIQKRASLRYVWNWSQHIMYGDLHASCPADATGEPGIVLPTCTWVGNFRGYTFNNSLEFLGSFDGGGQSVGRECFRWSAGATSSPGNSPQNGVYEGQGTVELYTAPGVEFGLYSTCGNTPSWCPVGASPTAPIYQDIGFSYNGEGATLHFQTLSNRPTPPRDPRQRNFVRATIYDLTGFWSGTPFHWCQDGPGGCQAPPPLPPNVASDPEPSTAQDTGEAVAAGPPSSTAIATALRRAKNFWRDRGQLTSCMDNTRVAWVGPDDKLTQKHDNGGMFNKSLREIGAAAGGSGVPGAVVFGCNSFGYHQQGNGGYVTDQRIIVNRAQNWPLRKLCVTLAHELGHMDRQGTHPYGYTHGDNGGLAIMQGTADGRINVDPKTWPPCQSG